MSELPRISGSLKGEIAISRQARVYVATIQMTVRKHLGWLRLATTKEAAQPDPGGLYCPTFSAVSQAESLKWNSLLHRDLVDLHLGLWTINTGQSSLTNDITLVRANSLTVIHWTK